jgi:hypothetical protein
MGGSGFAKLHISPHSGNNWWLEARALGAGTWRQRTAGNRRVAGSSWAGSSWRCRHGQGRYDRWLLISRFAAPNAMPVRQAVGKGSRCHGKEHCAQQCFCEDHHRNDGNIDRCRRRQLKSLSRARLSSCRGLHDSRIKQVELGNETVFQIQNNKVLAKQVNGYQHACSQGMQWK